MKHIIVDMKDMSDSKEVYESRPNPFFYYIYLSYFGNCFSIISVDVFM